MYKRNKILITGTGRCGTTFLMRIFTKLGLPTGIPINDTAYVNLNCNSGYEFNIKDLLIHDGLPSDVYILKSPEFLKLIPKVVKDYNIDLIIVPIRNYEECAKSRERHDNLPGGLIWGALDNTTQLKAFYEAMSIFLLNIAEHDLNTIFVDFYKMTNDSLYLYDKLSYIINKFNISYDIFLEAYNKSSNESKSILYN